MWITTTPSESVVHSLKLQRSAPSKKFQRRSGHGQRLFHVKHPRYPGPRNFPIQKGNFCALKRSKESDLAPESSAQRRLAQSHRTPEQECRKFNVRRGIRLVPVLMRFYPQRIIGLWVQAVENGVDIPTLVHTGKA